MNFQPKFEQYKVDQAKLEIIPTIKPEFHFTINDAAKKVLEHEALTQKEVDDLEMVYISTQDVEKELVIFLDFYRSNEVLTKDEFLIVATYFLTANQNGPNSTNLKESLMNLQMPVENFHEVTEPISIPEYTREVLTGVYKKVVEYRA